MYKKLFFFFCHIQSNMNYTKKHLIFFLETIFTMRQILFYERGVLLQNVFYYRKVKDQVILHIKQPGI